MRCPCPQSSSPCVKSGSVGSSLSAGSGSPESRNNGNLAFSNFFSPHGLRTGSIPQRCAFLCVCCVLPFSSLTDYGLMTTQFPCQCLRIGLDSLWLLDHALVLRRISSSECVDFQTPQLVSYYTDLYCLWYSSCVLNLFSSEASSASKRTNLLLSSIAKPVKFVVRLQAKNLFQTISSL